jgi:hypothetical protein
MRTVFFAVTVVSSAALAQYENGGVWTGYVGGWKPNTQSTGTRVGVPAWTQQVPQWQWWQMANIQSQWALQAELQRRAAQVQAERRLAAEREAMLQRQLDEERRLTAEKELLALQRLEAERATAAAAAAAAKVNAEKAAQAAPVVASREEEKPVTPGNDIFRWVDDEGVVHYSTRVPDSVKASAKRVGGSR